MSRRTGGTAAIGMAAAAIEAPAAGKQGCGIIPDRGLPRNRTAGPAADTAGRTPACGPAGSRRLQRERYEDEPIVGYHGAYRYSDGTHHARTERDPGDDAGVGERFRGRAVDPAPASGITMDCLPDSVQLCE